MQLNEISSAPRFFSDHTVPVLHYCYKCEYGEDALDLSDHVLWSLWEDGRDDGTDRLEKTVEAMRCAMFKK